VLPERIAGLRAGVTPYQEAGIDEMLRKHLSTNRISFVDDFEVAARGADFIVLTVGTPSAEDGSADLRGLDAAVDAILKAQIPGSTVIVLRSTVPAGTSEAVASRLSGYTVIYAPEFLREGSAVYDFLHPDRIVIGANDHDAAVSYARLFETLNSSVIFTSLQDAELIKGFSNAFLATKISFANEVANFCSKTGANSDDVLRGMGYDTRIGEKFLAPGIGFGGPCFEKDVKSLYHVAGKNGAGRELLAAVLAVNKHQPQVVVDLLTQELGTLDGATIGIWGLAFKAGTSDVRDSLALRIVENLIDRGAHVRAYDPAVHALPYESKCTVVDTPLAAAEADALLVLTEWPVFASIDPALYASKLRRGVVVDGRNVLDPERVSEAGLLYKGVGRSTEHRTLSAANAV
jgi:UDPglucose 6-dehydrogenase